MQNLFFSLLLFFAIIGCSNNNQNSKPDASKSASAQKITANDSNIVKVYVDENGVITADGNLISLASLDSSFNKLKMSNGTVYYSRANGQGNPPPESMKVMELVVKHSLPIRLYTDKTFTEIFKPD